VTAYSTVSVLHTRLRRRVASSFAVGFSSRSGRSRDRIPDRDARVFRPRSRDSDPSCGMDPRCGSGGHELPAPIGWGSERGGSASGACCRLPTRPVSLLDCRAAVARPETRCLRTGLALARSSLHAPSTVSMKLDDGPNIIAGHHHRGARAGLATFTRPSTLAATRMTDDPVRVSAFAVARRRVLAGPRGLPSSTSPRCLEIRFYNRRFAPRAPAETSPSETVCRPPWENPPVVGSSDRPWLPRFRRFRGPRRTTLRSSSLQRPRA